jgi:poly(hydroxyalkanoate) granule-associated protein
MVKKLKALAGGAGDKQFAQTVKDSAQQIWLAGLGAFAKAQAEGMKAFRSLVKEGESLQSRTTKVAGEKVAEAAAKASGTWDKLEQVFEDRVARSLSSLGVPTKKDIETLSKRVAELTEVVQNLNGGKPSPAPPRRQVSVPRLEGRDMGRDTASPRQRGSSAARRAEALRTSRSRNKKLGPRRPGASRGRDAARE